MKKHWNASKGLKIYMYYYKSIKFKINFILVYIYFNIHLGLSFCYKK